MAAMHDADGSDRGPRLITIQSEKKKIIYPIESHQRYRTYYFVQILFILIADYTISDPN